MSWCFLPPTGEMSLSECIKASPGFLRQRGRWVQTAWRWCRSAAPAPGRSPESPGSRQSAAKQRHTESDQTTGSEFQPVTHVSGQCLASTCNNNRTYLTKVWVGTVFSHLLYTFARSARCISWNNVAAVDSRDKETWSLLSHNIKCPLWIHVAPNAQTDISDGSVWTCVYALKTIQ